MIQNFRRLSINTKTSARKICLHCAKHSFSQYCVNVALANKQLERKKFTPGPERTITFALLISPRTSFFVTFHLMEYLALLESYKRYNLIFPVIQYQKYSLEVTVLKTMAEEWNECKSRSAASALRGLSCDITLLRFYIVFHQISPRHLKDILLQMQGSDFSLELGKICMICRKQVTWWLPSSKTLQNFIRYDRSENGPSRYFAIRTVRSL